MDDCDRASEAKSISFALTAKNIARSRKSSEQFFRWLLVYREEIIEEYAKQITKQHKIKEIFETQNEKVE